MACLEIITLRVGGTLKASLQRELFEELSPANLLKENVKEMRVFKRNKGAEELAIAFIWDAGQCGAKGSLLGQHISAALEEFGSISHTVWEEVFSPEQGPRTSENQ